jgi:hypothetical protein
MTPTFIGQKYAFLEAKVLVSSILRSFKVETSQRPEDIKFEVEVD